MRSLREGENLMRKAMRRRMPNKAQNLKPNNMTTECFNGVYWDTTDLLSCKQAFSILLNMDCPFEELSELDFGNLNIFSVAEEMGFDL